MFSLQSYKDQVYNIGSPSPSPLDSPSKLPEKSEGDFSFSPVKPSLVTRKSKRKIESSENSLEGPTKKAKMISKDQLDKAMEKERAVNKQNIDKVLEQLAAVTKSLGSLSSQLTTFTDETKKNNEEVKGEIAAVNDNMKTLQQSVDDTRTKFESKLVELEGTVSDLQKSVAENNAVTADTIKDTVIPVIENDIIPKVKADLKKEILAPVESAWDAIKAQEVHDHDHNLIVFNFKTEDTNLIRAAGDFFKNVMKVSEEDLLKLSIKQAYKLGKGKDGKPPPLLIRFGHPSERNHILTFSKNINDKKISVEKDIPKSYQKQHKEFKEIAFKLRNMPDLEFQTQIIFDGPYMHLRYKRKDAQGEKYHYVIHSSWKPPLQSSPSESSSLRTPSGTKATPIPDPNTLEKANAAILMSLKGMTAKHTEDTLKNNFKDFLNAEHKDLVTSVKNTKRADLIIVYCVNWEASNSIANQYKGKFMDHEVSFSLFSKKNPAAME